MQEIYAEPIKAELITARLKRDARRRRHRRRARCRPQRTKEFAKTVVDAGVDMFVIRGTTVSRRARLRPGRAAEPQGVHLRARRPGDRRRLRDVPGRAAPDAHRRRRACWSASAAAPRTPPAPCSASRCRWPRAVADVAAARRDYLDESGGRYVHVIADGSIGRSGDIAKAIACGADAVMVGSPFARATDAPGQRLPLGRRGAPRRAAARRAGRDRHRRHARGDPVRALPRRRRHDEPRRRPAPRDGDHRLHRAQGVPAGRGRRRRVATGPADPSLLTAYGADPSLVDVVGADRRLLTSYGADPC